MRDKRIAQILSVSAVLIDWLLRNLVGTTISVLLASFALFFFVRFLGVSKRVTRIRNQSEDRFISYTCALTFGFSNFISKLLIPFIASSSDIVASAGFLLTSAVVYYLAFRTVWIKSGHRDRYSHRPISSIDGKKEDTLQRTQNGLVLLSVVSGLDGADLMLLVQLITVFLSEIYGLTKITTGRAFVILRLFQKWFDSKRTTISLRKIVQHLAEDLKKIETKDLEKTIWDRAFYLMRYKKGLAFLVFSFVGSLPLMFFSWTIDFLNFNPNYLIGLVLLTVPSVVSFALVHMPTRVIHHSREKWRRRILALSLVPSVLAIMIAATYPSIVPLAGQAAETAGIEQIRLKVGIATLLALFPLFLGLPLFFGIVSNEADDLSNFVKWMKIVGIAPFALMTCLTFVSQIYSSMTLGAFLVSAYINFIIGGFFYVFISHATLSALQNYQARYGLNISSLTPRLFNPGPNLTTIVPSSALGIGIFVLLQMPPFFLWKAEQILPVSLILSLAIGLLLQYPSLRGIRGSIWISSFAMISYLLSFFFFTQCISPHYFIQILTTWGYRIIGIPLAMIPVGNVTSWILVRYLRSIRFETKTRK